MELDLHQLELRYEPLRRKCPRAERALVASLLEVGQQLPVVVIAGDQGRFVLVDGYKRVRALRALARDTAQVTTWDLEEAEALLLEHLMRPSGEDAFSQGWLLQSLHQRFSLSEEQLAVRFDKSKSWVSRRLALVQELPEEIQQLVRSGALGAHTAMKYLVPLARANPHAAVRLSAGITSLKLSSRQVGALYSGWQSGSERTKELILSSPLVYLRALQAAAAPLAAKSPTQLLLDELGMLSSIARRAKRRLESGVLAQLLPGEPEEVAARVSETKAAVQALFNRLEQETPHAG